ncbi:MAG: hypothetical protein MHM6MM_005136 [Cercozoa sp. M6MM]
MRYSVPLVRFAASCVIYASSGHSNVLGALAAVLTVLVSHVLTGSSAGKETLTRAVCVSVAVLCSTYRDLQHTIAAVTPETQVATVTPFNTFLLVLFLIALIELAFLPPVSARILATTPWSKLLNPPVATAVAVGALIGASEMIPDLPQKWQRYPDAVIWGASVGAVVGSLAEVVASVWRRDKDLQ